MKALLFSLVVMFNLASPAMAQASLQPDWTFYASYCEAGNDGFLRIVRIINAGPVNGPSNRAYIESPQMYASPITVGIIPLESGQQTDLIIGSNYACSRKGGCVTKVTLNFPVEYELEANIFNNELVVNCPCVQGTGCQERP